MMIMMAIMFEIQTLDDVDGDGGNGDGGDDGGDGGGDGDKMLPEGERRDLPRR